jgi:hypothetical protein
MSRFAAVSSLLAKKLRCGLVEFVAVAAELPHQLAGLLTRDVVPAGKVVDTIRLVRSTPPLRFFRFAMRSFRSQSPSPILAALALYDAQIL